jgi:hypothetical protein
MRQAVAMPNSLPFPIRVVAGLIATGIQTARRIPDDLPGLGVELAGRVTKATLQLRQQITDLAIRGDELLQSGDEPQEHPAWAHFDDEQPADQPPTAEQPTAEQSTAEQPTTDESPDPNPRFEAPTRSTPKIAEPIKETSELLPGYPGMTMAQVRGHFRTLSAADIRELLERETNGENRPSFVTMLTNRLATLEHDAR